MKKFLLLFLSVWITFACSEEKEIPSIEPPIVNPDQNEDPKPAKADSIYYQLNVDGFELVAATEDSTCLFLQTDTTFAFRCLFDSCGSNRMLAYCDSTGLVERIVVDEQIVNILHHADKKKMDIFYKDTEGKMAWIKDVDSPYKNLSSRAEGDVPYSAISIVNDLSYAVYTIINTYDVVKHKPWENFIDKYSRKEFYNTRSTVALKLITQILGEEYKVSVSNHISTIVTVMSDYSKWVREELYGTAIPHLRKYAVRETVDGLILTAYVTDVDSLSNEFAVGVIVAENGNELNSFNYLDNQSSDYDSQKINYSYSFMNPELVKKGITLVTGKDYKFIPYLAPASTSKYAIGIKSLLDCYKYGSSQTHLLLETKAEFKSMEDDQATIKLSVENADKRIKMGIIYSEHSKMLKHEYEKVEHEPTFKEGVLSNNFEKEVKIERLESGYTYYMPYVIYDDDILNRPLDYSISSETIYETDQIFYGKKDSIVSNPITGDAELNGNTLKFKGRFYTELEEDIEEYGICYSMDDKEINVENSSVQKVNSHQDGNYEVSINENATFFYRAYIKIKDKYYYGEIKKYLIDDNSIRKVLTKIYNDCNGSNWTYRKNWCTDLPVTEWEGVERNKGTQSTGYIYHFKFMSMNYLTGTLTIEDCNEHMLLYNCDYTNNNLQGLHLKNCSNLYFDNMIYQNGIWKKYDIESEQSSCWIGTISNQLKSICIDNVQLTVIDRDKNLFVKTKSIRSNILGESLNKWENFEIRNCNDLDELLIFDSPNLKKVIFENNTLLDYHCWIMIGDCPLLSEIVSKDNYWLSEKDNFIGTIQYSINNCNNLDNVIIESEFEYMAHFFHAEGSQIKKLTLNGNINFILDKPYDNTKYPIIKDIQFICNSYGRFDVDDSGFEWDKTGIESLVFEGCIIDAALNFSNNPTIRNIEIKDWQYWSDYTNYYENGINLNGCINLENFTLIDGDTSYPIIDVRNTPKLKTFNCQYAKVGKIEFDSHMNDVNIDCLTLKIVQEIPYFYTGRGSGYFHYQELYVYYNDPKTGERKHITNDYGWCYKGEPQKGYHGPN